MEPHYEDDTVTLHHGDCLEVMRAMPDASVDAVVTDPPYGLGFMGKEWDSGKSFVERKAAKRNTFDHVGGNHNPTSSADASRTRRVESRKFGEWCELWTAECLRVLKPGGHLLAFGGTRTWHRLACAVEDAGFEVRDSIAWLYGSGFPKSLDVSKAIDKAAGAEREVVGQSATVTPRSGKTGAGFAPGGVIRWGDEHYKWEDAPAEAIAYYTERAATRGQITAPATPVAERWQGWGTALKPAFEPIVVARKPLAGTVAANVLEHGTGALNIDGCRVGTASGLQRPERRGRGDTGGWADYTQEPGQYGTPDGSGRWPTNVLLDDTQAAVLDEQSGERPGMSTQRDLSASGKPGGFNDGGMAVKPGVREGFNDTGGASRFFPTFRYEAKAPASERPKVNGTAHPTVKPLDLMRWLVRLVTPPGGTVLEPFAGSGTTVEACVVEGFKCVAIEKTDEYLPLITQRINRQRDPVAYMHAAGDDLGLFDLT